MFYSLLFRSRWAALFWVGWICLGIYVRTPREGSEAQNESVTYVEPANPWAKDK